MLRKNVVLAFKGIEKIKNFVNNNKPQKAPKFATKKQRNIIIPKNKKL